MMKVIASADTDSGRRDPGIEGGEIVQILAALMLASAPYTALKGYIFHPTLAEGFFGLMQSVKPLD
jgi:hypothetical protein